MVYIDNIYKGLLVFPFIAALFGIYPGPYRLADVEDLICNTMGGAGGYYIASVFAGVLPSRDEIDEKCRAAGSKVTGMRRVWTCLFDYVCIAAVYVFLHRFSRAYISFGTLSM